MSGAEGKTKELGHV